jgi:sn-glycerol 3-phosphate transport system permease protein
MIGRVSDRVSTTTLGIIASPTAVTRPRPRRSVWPVCALLLPSGIFPLAFTYWPVLQVALGSLSVRTFGGAAHWGFGNYARLFAVPHFASAVRNNLLYAAGTVIPSLALALLSPLSCARVPVSPHSSAR